MSMGGVPPGFIKIGNRLVPDPEEVRRRQAIETNTATGAPAVEVAKPPAAAPVDPNALELAKAISGVAPPTVYTRSLEEIARAADEAFDAQMERWLGAHPEYKRAAELLLESVTSREPPKFI